MNDQLPSPRPATPHSRRILHLDGWRGVSILLVLFGHFLPETAFNLGALGVEMFFVLSGRLMAEILFVERFPLGQFFRRRFSRIFPGLAVFVLLVWLAAGRSSLAFKPSAVLAALTFTLNYAMVLQHGVAAIENLWSLCIEEHAYVLLGALAFLARPGRFDPRWAILGVAAASLADAAVSTLLLHQGYRQVYWRTDAHLGSIFLAGAAGLFLRRRPGLGWVSMPAFGLGVALFLAPDSVRYSLGTAMLALAICTLDEAPFVVRAALAWKPLTSLGLWSYSFYLWQQPFYRLALNGHLPAWVGAPLALVCGLASFCLIERPARLYLNRHWRAPSVAPEPLRSVMV
jgi:peptidoglycan/LPS O-acetylase OafA/YrhL